MDKWQYFVSGSLVFGAFVGIAYFIFGGEPNEDEQGPCYHDDDPSDCLLHSNKPPVVIDDSDSYMMWLDGQEN